MLDYCVFPRDIAAAGMLKRVIDSMTAIRDMRFSKILFRKYEGDCHRPIVMHKTVFGSDNRAREITHLRTRCSVGVDGDLDTSISERFQLN